MPKRAGRPSAAQTPAPKSDKIYGSKKNPKGSATEKKAKSIKLSDKTIDTLKEKLDTFKKSHPSKKNITLGDLKAVYRRGSGAYSSSHRPTITGGGRWGKSVDGKTQGLFTEDITGRSCSKTLRQAGRGLCSKDVDKPVERSPPRQIQMAVFCPANRDDLVKAFELQDQHLMV